MKRTKFDVIVDLWISLVINIVMSIVLPVLAIGFITWDIFIKGFIIAFIVSTIFVFVIPIIKWGQDFAAFFNAKPRTVMSQLLATVIVALMLGTPMSLLMTAINAGIGPHFVAAWLSCYLYTLLTVYVSALIGVWTGIPLAMKVCRIPKDTMNMTEND